MELLCIDFLKVDPSEDGKENALLLTDTFSKFSQAFVTPNQKAPTVTKVLVHKWFYVYGIPTQINSDKDCSFGNYILIQLYSMHSIKQSTTMPYTPCGNSICEQFNCTLLNLLKTLPKEQKSYWHLHVPSLVFAYNATSHNIVEYQPYGLMFGCKAPTICGAWHGLPTLMMDTQEVKGLILTNSISSSQVLIGVHLSISSKWPKFGKSWG